MYYICYSEKYRFLEKSADPAEELVAAAHAVTWTDLCRSLELPVAASRGWMSKAEYVQQVLTAFPAALPATASVRGDLYL